MRENYYKHLTEARERLAKENPEMSKYEVLGKARAELGAQCSSMLSLRAALAFARDIAIDRYSFVEPLTANLLQNTCLHYSGSSSLSHPKVEVSSRTSQPHEESECFGVVTTTPGARQEVQEAED